MCSQPDELAFAQVDVWLEVRCKFGPDLGIQSVRRHYQVVRAGKLGGAVDLGFEAQVDIQLSRSLLQKQQKLFAANAAEAVPRRNDALAAVMHGDVVPIGEM